MNILKNLTWQAIVGEVKPVTIKCWDAEDPTRDLSASTATIWIYGETGAQQASGTCTVTGTTTIRVSWTWDTSAVPHGRYRAVFKVTLSGIIHYFQAACILLPCPAPG